MSTLDARKNFAIAQVSTGYDASATSITLATGKGALFPQPSTDGAFNLVWWNSTAFPSPADDPNKEIVRCTARTGDVLTLSRAQEGTTATVKNITGQTYKLQLGPTKKTIDDIETQLDLKEVSANKGAANGYAPLGSDSKVPPAYMPQISITDTFVVTSQVEMLALTAQTGDVAVRTDENKTYILKGTDPSVLGDWEWLRTPTDNVLSVNGMTGTVVLTTSNIAEGSNLYFTDARARAAFTISTGLTLATATLTANLSTGVSGGQSVIGGTASGENLTLSSTSHATKGKIIFGTSAYDEVNNRLGIGGTSPSQAITLESGNIYLKANGAVILNNTNNNNQWYMQNRGSSAATLVFGLGTPLSNDQITFDGSGNVGLGVAPNEKLHVYSATTLKPVVLIENANADGSAPQLRFYKNTASPFSSDFVGHISFTGKDSGNNDKEYAAIKVVSSNAVAATAGGQLQFINMQNNVATRAMTLFDTGNFAIGDTTTTYDAAIGRVSVTGAKNTSNFSGMLNLVDSTAQTTGVGGGVVFSGKYTDAGAYALQGAIMGSKLNATTGNTLANMDFYVRPSSAGIFKSMVLYGSGNLMGMLKVGRALSMVPTQSLDLSGHFAFTPVAEPSQSGFSVALAGAGAGNVNNGTHYYSVEFYTAEGVTGQVVPIQNVTVTDLTTNGRVSITNIPTSSDPRVIGRRIYRGIANDTSAFGYYLATIADNTTTTYTDNIADASLDLTDRVYRKANTTAGKFYSGATLFAQASDVFHTFFGVNAGAAVTRGDSLSFFGGGAGQSNTTGSNNSFFGYIAGNQITTGSNNSFFGYIAGNQITTGSDNTGGGYASGIGNVTGSGNTWWGFNALRNDSSLSYSNNTAIGWASLQNLIASNNSNTALGYQSGYGFRGSNNIHIGQSAGYTATPATIGDYNINIGVSTGTTHSSGAANNVLIGKSITLQTVAGSDQLSIMNMIFGTGNSSTGTTISSGSIGIGVATPADRFQILDGTGYITMGQPTAGYGGITFANAAITTSNYSLIGDGTSTYLGAATGGTIYHRINNVSAMFMNATTLSLNTITTINAGAEWSLNNTVVTGVAIADFKGQGTNPMALRVVPGVAATGYSILGELTASFFEFHRASTGTDRLLITAPVTAASGYRIISYNATPRPITLGFSTNASSYTTAITISTSGVAVGLTTTVATAVLHLSAGTATAGTAPFKLTSGTNLTTGEAGAMEYDGTNLFFTRSGTTRESVLVGNSGATAPATNAGTPTTRYGGNTNYLGDPNSWAGVNIGGVAYKIPLYT